MTWVSNPLWQAAFWVTLVVTLPAVAVVIVTAFLDWLENP